MRKGFPSHCFQWLQDQRLLSKPVRIPPRTRNHWADLLFPFLLFIFCWCKVQSGWTFGKDTLKREQKWEYATDEHLVTLEETAQGTNPASHKCALLVPRPWASAALSQPQKGCFGDGLQGRNQSFLMASGLFTGWVLHLSPGQVQH